MDKEKLKEQREDLRYKEVEEVKPKAKKKASINKPPAGYIKIDLDSIGKLFAPKTLHFRNYTVSELLKLSENATNNDEFLPALIDVLNDMVWEDFNCMDLHEKELELILMNIYAGFWAKSLPNQPYRINEDKDSPEYNTEENIAKATIPFENIKTKHLEGNVKPKVTITIGEESVKFKIITIGDMIEAFNYKEEYFAEEERKWSDFKYEYEEYERNKSSNGVIKLKIDNKKKEEYEKYMIKKTLFFVNAMESVMLVEYNGKEIKSLKEKIKLNESIGAHFFNKFKAILGKYFDYGIDNNITFIDLESGKELTRRFEFRTLDFLPDFQEESVTESDFSFSD